jgi:crotonobetainyl-CoA:carnitine CoA-transferase CaiB-like acyl-CoA transferase
MRPLEGVRIIALSQFGAGPYGMMLLADLGAEIIKIEDPSSGGDVARYVAPGLGDQDSLYFQSLNRNNRCITLDLRSDAGIRVFHDLVRVSDGLFSNLRGDLPAKLGMLHSQLADINPRIVCCSLSGFGMTGPRASEPGYDYLIQAYSGMMSLTGEPDSPPARAGVSVIDFSGGIAAALGLVTGIMQARQSGKGCDVDVSLLDTAISMLNYLAIWTMNSDFTAERLPNSSHPTLYPSQVLKTADGYMAIMCAKEKFWQALVHEIAEPEFSADPRFTRFVDRYAHRDALWTELDRIFKQRTTADWLGKLRGKVPCAPVNSVEEALRDEQVLARQMVIEVEHPEFGVMRQTGNPIKFSGDLESHSPASPLGADTDTILTDVLGYSAERIAALRASGAI